MLISQSVSVKVEKRKDILDSFPLGIQDKFSFKWNGSLMWAWPTHHIFSKIPGLSQNIFLFWEGGVG